MRSWPVIDLVGLVVVILFASGRRSAQPVFRWLPVPLWCYLAPLIAKIVGVLPNDVATYRALTTSLLPFALGLLLFGVDVPAIAKSGGQALVATLVGALAIVVGTATGVWIFRSLLPADAWKGAGALASTWTGGTMNLLAIRAVLDVPDPLFAPLIIVDAVVAYSWMALLVAISAFQDPLNRWLRAGPAVAGARAQPEPHAPVPASPRGRRLRIAACALTSLVVTMAARLASMRLPISPWVSSASGWTVLLITTVALALSYVPAVRRAGTDATQLGYPCLYLVLAATGAQADLAALKSAPVWLLLGAFVAFVHGATLLVAGRQLRASIGTLATASQANIGGLVSAPLVGAVYSHALMPVGLLLAVGCNAVGTYLGLGAAMLARFLLRSS